MKQGVLQIALEEAELQQEAALAAIPEDQLNESHIDGETVAISSEIDGVAAAIDQKDETVSIDTSVAEMVDVVQDEVNNGHGLTQPMAQVVESALEHYGKRLGFKRRVIPAMESFEKDRLAASKLTLENLKDLRERLQPQLVLANEGIFERFANLASRVFTSSSKMLGAVIRLKPEQLGDVRSLGVPAWGRVFALAGKSPVAGPDIAKLLDLYVRTQEGPLVQVVNEATTALARIMGELKRSTFIADDDATNEIVRIAERVATQLEKLRVPQVGNGGKADVEVTSCDKASFGAIVQGMRKVAQGGSLDKAVERFHEQVWSLWGHKHFRVAGNMAADIRAANEAMERIGELLDDVVPDIYTYQLALEHGAYKYLTISCKQ